MTVRRRTRDLTLSRTSVRLLLLVSLLGLAFASLAQNHDGHSRGNDGHNGNGQRSGNSNSNAGRDQRSSPPPPSQPNRPAPNQTARPAYPSSSYPSPSYPPPSNFARGPSASQNVSPSQPQQRLTQVGPRSNQEHLPQWLDRHKSLPDQQRALEAEPGFRDLAPQTQQRMHDRLLQLNQMPPQQRQRVIERTEAMERLSPQQRQEVRSAMSNLSSLTPDRRQTVARTFRELRNLPPSERQRALDAQSARGQFTPGETSTLRNLLSVEPLLPPPSVPGRTSEPPR